MSEPSQTEAASPKRETLLDASRDGPGRSPTPTQPKKHEPAIRPGVRQPFGWHALLLVVAIVAIVGSGAFVTHQLLTYGSLVPSINGGWYGPYAVAQPGTAHYVNEYSLYVVFATGHGNQVSATTSSCFIGSNSPYTQGPTVGLSFTGTLSGAHFTMAPQHGDVESDLSWSGTYSTNQVHIDFYPDGTPALRNPYANLRRGTYSDFLQTCTAR
jgi:hypothetical protein